jgi:RHS repeat-associated protein
MANEMLSLSGIFNETRQYNSMFQLTQITVPGVLNMQYVFSATQNNGKITSQTDLLSGEVVQYTYDSLNRLATAQTADNPSVTQWGQSYTYDGFGNLTDQNGIKGTVPTMHVVYNASTNRQTGDTADANGNIGSGYIYDIENRLLQAGTGMPQYGYDGGNKRVWRGQASPALDEFTFWSGNQKWATYSLAVSGSTVYFTLTGTNVYFGGRMIAKGAYNSGGSGDKVTLSAIATDRLGSVVNNGVNKFYPYGQERPSATTNDKEKFTGYFRDAATGLDYADQRYEQPGVGRFMTPDRAPSARLTDPGTWNRYAYAGGDPINNVDRTGKDYFDAGYGDWGSCYDFYSCASYDAMFYDPFAYAMAVYNEQLANYNYQVGLVGSIFGSLVDEGILSGYSVDWTSYDVTLSFDSDSVPIGEIIRGIGACTLIPGCIETVGIGGGVVIVGSAAIIWGPRIVEAIRNWYEAHKAPKSGPLSPTGSWPGWDATAPKGDGWKDNGLGGFSRPGADGGTETIKPDLRPELGNGGDPHWDWSTTGGSTGNWGGRIYDDPNSNKGIFVPNR